MSTGTRGRSVAASRIPPPAVTCRFSWNIFAVTTVYPTRAAQGLEQHRQSLLHLRLHRPHLFQPFLPHLHQASNLYPPPLLPLLWPIPPFCLRSSRSLMRTLIAYRLSSRRTRLARLRGRVSLRCGPAVPPPGFFLLNQAHRPTSPLEISEVADTGRPLTNDEGIASFCIPIHQGPEFRLGQSSRQGRSVTKRRAHLRLRAHDNSLAGDADCRAESWCHLGKGKDYHPLVT